MTDSTTATETRHLPRIIISAPKSGSGKTLVTIALLQALKNRGLNPSAFKCGPDYIDPLFHSRILGVPSKNLDLFFTPPDTTRELFLRNNQSPISVIEGVMGLYDGIGGCTSDASAYHLATVLRAPVALVVDAKGMSYSLVAEINGFVSLDAEHLVAGVILNNCSETLYQNLKPLLQEKTGVPLLGYLPKLTDISIESRYLGLKLPDEITSLKAMVQKAAVQLEQTVDIEAVLKIAETAPTITAACKKPDTTVKASTVRIGIARDEAFCFYYEDNLQLLRDLGAELVEFSPVHDTELPPALDGLILGGGYPELFSRQLSENTSMKDSLRAAIEKGMPSFAECGGFLYLHDSITTEDGSCYPMAGVIPGNCWYTGRLVRFGYISVQETGSQTAAAPIRGHEFHYYDSTNPGTGCTATKPVTGRNWSCMHTGENHWWGFPHLYYQSNPSFATIFIQWCNRYHRNNKEF